MSRCLQCGSDLSYGSSTCSHCGAKFSLASSGGTGHSVPVADATGGLIPYNNPPALKAYYFGLFSILPILGLPLGIAAVVLGFRGLKLRKTHPQVKGSAHAFVGIGCGGLGVLFTLLILVTTFIAAAASSS